MSKLTDLRDKLEKKRKDLHEIFDRHPDMDLSEDDVATVRALNDEMTDLGKEYDDLVELTSIKDRNIELGQKLGQPSNPMLFPGGGDTEKKEEIQLLSSLIADNPEFKEHHRDSKPNFGFTIEGVTVKTLMTTTANGFPPFSSRGPRLVDYALRRPVVADLVPQDTIDQPAVIWMEETVFDNQSAMVAEGGTKPESGLTFVQRTTPVELLATWLPVTQQQLDDVNGIRSLIDNRLTMMLQLTEEVQLLNGSGTSPQLIGFYNKSGIQTQALGADPAPDAFYKAMMKIDDTPGFSDPSGIIMHPNDWTPIRLLRTADGMYIWGHPADEGPERLWGLPVVCTSAATDGTGLVGDFRMYSHISRKQGIRIDVSDSHQDFFVKNQLAIRIEERLCLEIYRASAFCTVTGI